MIEQAVRMFLEGVGEDPAREGLQDTPQLVAEAMGSILSGYREDPAAVIDVIQGPDNLILIQDVPFFSVCQHHLLPFFGAAEIAILPDGGRIAGFGSLARALDAVARRLQIQERLTEEVANALETALRPRGVWVSLRARQFCMEMPEGRHHGTETVTLAVRGALREEPWQGALTSLRAARGR